MFGFFDDVFGSGFGMQEPGEVKGAEEVNASEVVEEEEINAMKEEIKVEDSKDDSSAGGSFMEEMFGSSFGFGDDFFAAPQPKQKPEKKASTESKSKTSAKTDGKGKTSKSDVDVTLPVIVRARNFAVTMEGEGTKKLSQIWDELLKLGYEQLEIDGCFNLMYVESLKSVFVCEKTYAASDNDTAVDLSDGKKITVCDGLLKAEFTLENFEGKEEDEVSLFDVSYAFSQVNPSYSGCKLAYDEKKAVAYPVFNKVEEKDFENTSIISLVKEGNSEVLSGESFKEIVGCYGEMSNKTTKVEVVLTKGGNNTGFLTYVSYSGYEKVASSSKSKTTKKVEEKFLLPLTVRIANWGGEYLLEPSDFGGKEKITLEEVKKNLGEKHKIFKDSSRKMDTYYDEEAKRLSVMFISGSKGCELIRTETEFLEAKKRTTFFDGIFADKNVRLRVLPTGNYLTYNGSGRELCVPKRMEWERKMPRMPLSILKEIVAYFKEDLGKEAMVRIYYDKRTGNFSFEKAKGDRSKVHINYEFVADVDLLKGEKVQVMDIHSHNTMPAFFSSTDDEDEAYRPGLFGVIGNLHSTPQMLFRAGVDGMFTQYPVSEFFES